MQFFITNLIMDSLKDVLNPITQFKYTQTFVNCVKYILTE